jgi:hypothetical protein
MTLDGLFLQEDNRARCFVHRLMDSAFTLNSGGKSSSTAIAIPSSQP